MKNSPFLFPLDSAIKSNQNSVAIRALCDLLDWAPRLREELSVLNDTYSTALLVQFDDAVKINFPMEFLGFFFRVPFDCLSTCAKFTQFQSEKCNLPLDQMFEKGFTVIHTRTDWASVGRHNCWATETKYLVLSRSMGDDYPKLSGFLFSGFPVTVSTFPPLSNVKLCNSTIATTKDENRKNKIKKKYLQVQTAGR